MAVERARRGQTATKHSKVDKDKGSKKKSLKTPTRGLKNDLPNSAPAETPPKRRGRPPKMAKAREAAIEILKETSAGKETGAGEETALSKETVAGLRGVVHGLGPNPDLVTGVANLPPGTNRKIIMLGIQILALPDIDINDPGQVSERLNEYLKMYAEADMKPTVNGMGNALGLDRRRLWEIATHQNRSLNINPESASLIERCYNLLSQYWEEYMQTGKINPVSGIFLAKNHFGYRDQTDFVVTAHSDEATFDSKSVMEKYDFDE